MQVEGDCLQTTHFVSWRTMGMNRMLLRKATPLNVLFVGKLLPATQCDVAPGGV
jgi:hypothetical protein